MKVKFEVWVLTDSRGDKKASVINECSDNLTIGGYDMYGVYQQYDSYEAYHAHGWAMKYGFKLESFNKEVEVDG